MSPASSGQIASVLTATVRAGLPAPVAFGAWKMTHREFAVVRVMLGSGVAGWAFGLTRDGAVAAQVDASVAPLYIGQAVEDRVNLYRTARRANRATHSSGVGLRALSLVDLACWDAAARQQDRSIASLLGTSSLPSMPATVIVGYPPSTMDADKTGAQCADLHAAGWRRFKMPVAADRAASVARLESARAEVGDAWLGCDGAWTFETVDDAVAFLDSVEDVGLGWFEDMFAPGDSASVAELRRRTDVPIAMGDDQGGSYYPEALLAADAVDVVRVDLTCMGGISGARPVVDAALAAGAAVAPHMFAHVHSQVLPAWGLPDVPIEWGARWTGVDPYADSLAQPRLGPNGHMEALDESPGFGELVNVDWIADQDVTDPHGILGQRR